MKTISLLMLVLVLGCSSLPEDIAERSAQISESCLPAAEILCACLGLLGYDDVTIVQGSVYVSLYDELHAWCEYSDGGHVYVIDPFKLYRDKYLHDKKSVINVYVESFSVKWGRIER